jgi:hypothetical protein
MWHGMVLMRAGVGLLGWLGLKTGWGGLAVGGVSLNLSTMELYTMLYMLAIRTHAASHHSAGEHCLSLCHV